jgi:dsRNA-specific ribonuclease
MSTFQRGRGRGRGGRGGGQQRSAGINKEYLKQHLNDFFGTRNGITLQPQENVNYTLETLTYMTPHNVADKITQIIIDQMQPNTPILLIECCAGIGGNTLSFLENPNVGAVASYELRPDRRQMLKNNIQAYNLGAKAAVQEGPFEGVSVDNAGAVLYLDPPWLPEGVSGTEAGKERYIMSGMKIGDYTLEQWMAAMPHVAMIVIRVPPGYQLGIVPGWQVGKIDLGKSDLLVAISSAGMEKAPIWSQKFGQKVEPLKTLHVETKATEIWRRELHTFLQTLLTQFLGSETATALLTPEYMPAWERAFTHMSSEPTDNYEFYETLGDKILKSTFAVYMTDKMGELSSQAMTEYENRYMSKMFQRQLADRFHFSDYIRIRDSEITVSIKEDLFESFVGALYEVTQKMYGRGPGFDFAYRFLFYAMQGVEFNPEYIHGHPKTQVTQIFSRLAWGIPIENVEKLDHGVRVTIELTPTAIQFLQNKGIRVTNPVLASDTASTKKGGSSQAYERALQKLAEIGATREWVEEQRNIIEWSHPEYQPYLPAARARLEREGYERMYFLTPRYSITPTSCTVQLIGVRKSDKKLVTIESLSACDINSGKIEVLKNYAEGK